MDAQLPVERPQSQSDSLDDTLKRSPVWYSDGSVVLQAETTQFRVHTSILSAGSTVFRDMFEVAQPPDSADSQVDGCPLVQLYDDKANDVELVLMALYDRNFYKTEKKSFAQVAAMWRLGKKYGFDELRDDALSRLESLFPGSLIDFLALYCTKNGITIVPETSPIDYYPGLVFDAINLARATNLLSILPVALYRACSAHGAQETVVQHLLNGLPRGSGDIVSLSDTDKTLCVMATFKLIKNQWCALYSAVGPKANCTVTDVTCGKASEAARDAMGFPVPSVLTFGRPVFGSRFLCPSCLPICNSECVAARGALWDELPPLFGLPSWDEIERDMAQSVTPLQCSLI
ncbi:hypothetical protein B0H19DRAFT_968185 [Mycena capillaripes]|nr:hypothetical protein B0H19DRAFT_968185 [Mycena capillaripes]